MVANIFFVMGLITFCGYLLGSVPFGFLLAKMKGIDLRKHGSGNIGATNVTRVLGKGSGRLIFLFDFLKGYVFCVGVYFLWGLLQPITPSENIFFYCSMFSPFFGHAFSVFLRFKGGKGVATLAGIVMFFYPMVFLLLALLFFVCYKVFRIISLASLVAMFLMPLLHYFSLQSLSGVGAALRFAGVFSNVHPWNFLAEHNFLVFAMKNYFWDHFSFYSTLWVVFVAAFVIFFHRSNIVRLLQGKELAFKK